MGQTYFRDLANPNHPPLGRSLHDQFLHQDMPHSIRYVMHWRTCYEIESAVADKA